MRGKKSAGRTQYEPDTEDGRVDQPDHADRRRVRVHERRARRRILHGSNKRERGSKSKAGQRAPSNAGEQVTKHGHARGCS